MEEKYNGWASQATFEVARELISNPVLRKSLLSYLATTNNNEYNYGEFCRLTGILYERTSTGFEFADLRVNDWEIVEGVFKAIAA